MRTLAVRNRLARLLGRDDWARTLRELGNTDGRDELRRLDASMRVCRRYSMSSTERLLTLYRLAKTTVQDGLVGDAVECGVCNGGSAGMIASGLSVSGVQRTLNLFDSFEGLPSPVLEHDGEDAVREWRPGMDLGHVDNVRLMFMELGIPLATVHIVPGWFEDTLRQARLGSISLLHIDADWYASVKLCLEVLFPLVSVGGYVVLDDYGHWQGCREAVDEYLDSKGIPVEMMTVDYTGRYFRKPPCVAG